MPARDIDVRGVAWSGAAIAAAILVVVGAVLLLLRLWHVAPGADRVRPPYDLVIEGPALQSAPQPDLRDERLGRRCARHRAHPDRDGHATARRAIRRARRRRRAGSRFAFGSRRARRHELAAATGNRVERR